MALAAELRAKRAAAHGGPPSLRRASPMRFFAAQPSSSNDEDA
jgi:hypothetical protein